MCKSYPILAKEDSAQWPVNRGQIQCCQSVLFIKPHKDSP